MDKVKLPREVAEALDDIKAHFSRWEWHVMLCIYDDQAIARNSAEVIRRFAEFHNNITIVLSALVNGYEVEETPEDRVREYYSKLTVKVKEKDDWDKFGVNLYRSEMQGIINTLNTLNIKISGVND